MPNKVIHYPRPRKHNGVSVTACGTRRLDGRDWGGDEIGKPGITEDPESVTCLSCLKSRWLSEVISEWPPVRAISGSFKLKGDAAAEVRCLSLLTVPLTKDEVSVLTTHLLERFPNFFYIPDADHAESMRLYRLQLERKKDSNPEKVRP